MRKRMVFLVVCLLLAALSGNWSAAAAAEDTTLLYEERVSPYLLPGKEGDTVILRWVMSSADPVFVHFGSKASETRAVVKAASEKAKYSKYYDAGTWFHTAVLPMDDGLVYGLAEPGQKPSVWYDVAGADDGVLSVFLTSDSHISNEKQAARLQAVVSGLAGRSVPELICHTGDINENSGFSPDILIRGAGCFRSTPVAAVCGNHDSLEIFYEHFTMDELVTEKPGVRYNSPLMDYCFEREGVLFIGLNMKCGDIPTHGDYVRKAVKEHPDCRWTVVMIHYSFFSNGSHGRDATLQHFQEQLAPVFAETDVDLVLSGHDHEYDRSLLYAGTQPQENTGGPAVKKSEGETLYVSLPTIVGTKFYRVENTLNEAPAAEGLKDEPGYVLAGFSERAVVLRAYTAEGAAVDSVVLSRNTP